MPEPEYYSEIGRWDPGRRLIEGYEIVFQQGAPGAEPTSSNPCDGWEPVRDPANPGVELGTVPYGTCSVTVAVPIGDGCAATPPEWTWLATRLVYNDCSVNGSRLADPDCPVAPTTRLGSMVSRHCGPVCK